MAIKQAFLRYLGGKFTMRSKIIEMLPNCRLYRSVFLGSGGVEFSIDPVGKSEIWNDYNGGLMNLYRVIQSPSHFKEFKELCEKTLFSEAEFEAAKTSLEIPMTHFGLSVNWAWKYYVRNRMSRMGDRKTFAVSSTRLRRNMNENVSSWLSAVDGLEEFHKRLKYVELRQMDFEYFITKFDHEDSVFICDPPYMASERTGGLYETEMSEADHERLLKVLSQIQGKFLLHGYSNSLYETFAKENGWVVKEIEVKKSSSSKKEKPLAIETIWKNY